MELRRCPHCHQRVPDEYPVCPFCGADMATGEPTRNGDRENTTGGATLGCVLMVVIYFLCGAVYVLDGNELFAVRYQMTHHRTPLYGDPAHLLAQRTLALWLGFLLPVALTGLPYLLLRRGFPALARGLGWCCLAALAIALGAPFLCGR